MTAQRKPNRAYVRNAVKPPEPKPCPRCYTPMRLIGNVWKCNKHGAPT